MDNKEIMILEGMIALQENELEMLYEAVAVNKWNSLDKSLIESKIKQIDAKFKDLKPIKRFSSDLSDVERKKVGNKFKLKKLGGKLIGAAVGGAVGGAIGNKFANKVLAQPRREVYNNEKQSNDKNNKIYNELIADKRELEGHIQNVKKDIQSNEAKNSKYDIFDSKQTLKELKYALKDVEYRIPNIKEEKRISALEFQLKNKNFDKESNKITGTTAAAGAIIGGTIVSNQQYFESDIRGRSVFIAKTKKEMKSILLLYRTKDNKIVIKSFKLSSDLTTL